MSVDRELIEKGIKPEPPDEDELRCMEMMAPGDYEIYSENLSLIVQEGKEIMTKMGISSMLHSGDSMAGLYTAKGDLVTAVCGTYLHCVTGQIPVKFILKYFKDVPTVGIKEGDVFYCNEAIYGGIHNPDQFAIMPIFYKGELSAWAVVGAHQAETGGSEPGGEITSAKTRHDEGMKLTPIKLAENYQIKEDLLKMMENFISRAPRMQVTDVKARVAAADRIRIRIQNLAEKKGPGFLKGLFRKMIQHTEEGVKARIRQWNDGTYSHVVFIDTTGAEPALIKTQLAIHKKGDRLILDFSGSSPEHEGSYNSLANVLRAHCAVNLYQFPFHDFPISSGMLQPIDFVIPHGTVLDADYEAAISCSPITASVAFPLLAVCFSKMMFDSDQRDLVCGFASANSAAPMVSGINQHGVRVTDFMGFPLNAWGLSARSDQDGVDVFGFPHGPWGKGPDVEDVENEFPLLHLYQKMLRDSGGYGKYRGGLGCTLAYVVHHVPYFAFSSVHKESKIPTHIGLFGGYSQTVIPGIQVTDTDLYDRMSKGDPDVPSDDYQLLNNGGLKGKIKLEHSCRNMRILKKGDIFGSSTQGGGGYGDVLERDPERVMVDLRLDTIAHWTAANLYKVAYDPDTLMVDYEETQRLREAARKERKTRGRPYEQFMKEWSAKRPKEEVLKYFGRWPTAEKNREIVRI